MCYFAVHLYRDKQIPPPQDITAIQKDLKGNYNIRRLFRFGISLLTQRTTDFECEYNLHFLIVFMIFPLL